MADETVIKFSSRQAQAARKRLARMRRAIEMVQRDIETANVRRALDMIADAVIGIENTSDPKTTALIMRAAETVLRAVRLDMQVRFAAPKLAALEAQNKVAEL